MENEKITNANNRTTDRKILDQGREDRPLLDMDEGKTEQGIRSVHVGSSGEDEEEVFGSQVGLRNNVRVNSKEDVRNAQMRQPSMCESESLETGDSKREHAGFFKEGEGKRQIQQHDKMHKGPQIEDNKEIGWTKDNSAGLHSLHKLQEGNEEKKIESKPTSISINSRGLVEAKNNSELIRYCGAMIASEMVPARFDNPQKLFGALMYVRGLGLPDSSIRNVANIHGTNSLFGDLPLALAQKSKEMSFFSEKWFDKEYKLICFEEKNLDAIVYGAVCFMSRGNGERQSFSFTMKDAEQAGLYPPKKKDGTPNPSSPWAKYTKLMLRYKSRSIALKSLFADAINGAAIAEYDFNHIEPEELDVTPTSNISSLNEKLQ